MNAFDPNALEAELHRLIPAKAPEAFLARLERLRSETPIPAATRSAASSGRVNPLWRARRWLPLAGAAAVAGLLFMWRYDEAQKATAARPSLPVATAPALKADNVEIDQRLVASFDAITRLPDGEPVRLRCQEWMDGVVLRDSARGVEIERRRPRLEVVNVSFETY